MSARSCAESVVQHKLAFGPPGFSHSRSMIDGIYQSSHVDNMCGRIGTGRTMLQDAASPCMRAWATSKHSLALWSCLVRHRQSQTRPDVDVPCLRRPPRRRRRMWRPGNLMCPWMWTRHWSCSFRLVDPNSGSMCSPGGPSMQIPAGES